MSDLISRVSNFQSSIFYKNNFEFLKIAKYSLDEKLLSIYQFSSISKNFFFFFLFFALKKESFVFFVFYF